MIQWPYSTPVLRVALWANELFSPVLRSKGARSPSLFRRQGVRVCCSSLCYLNKQFFLPQYYFSSPVMVSSPESFPLAQYLKFCLEERGGFHSWMSWQCGCVLASQRRLDVVFSHYQCFFKNIDLLSSNFPLVTI